MKLPKTVDRNLDFYGFESLLSDDERALKSRVRAFMDQEVIPVAWKYWEKAEFAHDLFKRYATLGLCGGMIQGYGCPGLSAVAVAVATMELVRGDGGLETAFGCSSGLAMGSIFYCGSEEQRQRWLPAMARMDLIGAFALTEPAVGSDASHIQTLARKDGDGYVLTGEKKWIGNAAFADLTIVWAQDDQTCQVSGFVVEKGTPGFETTVLEGKIARRTVQNAQIRLENCRVPMANKLTNARTFRDVARVLTATRFGVAAEAAGHAMAAYELALNYARTRQQFGRPIGGFQLIQDKLVRMLGETEALKLMVWRLAKMADAGTMTDGQASLAKAHCARRAREVVALGRELMGGNGILLEHQMAKHFADMEANYTYEGTNEINTLVVGREITGLQAFV